MPTRCTSSTRPPARTSPSTGSMPDGSPTWTRWRRPPPPDPFAARHEPQPAGAGQRRVQRRRARPGGGLRRSTNLRGVSTGPEFRYSDLLPPGKDDTPYLLITTEGVSTVDVDGQTFLKVSPAAIARLTAEAMHDIAHYLRPAHLAQLRKIIDDPESSGNDRFVALDLLKNVNISAGGVLPMCQDTGTAIVMGKKSEGVITGVDDGEWISRGVYDAYTKLNLRYSQLAPLTMWEERNTGTNLPAQIELYSTPGSTDAKPEYKFLFMAKGGG